MQPNACVRCRALLSAEASQGLCPTCRSQLGLWSQEFIVTQQGELTPPPPSPEEIQPLFPQLKILGLVGRGGMGAVYKATQRGLQRTVALKLLWVRPNPDAGFEERFAREGRALAQLTHQNVVAIHDAGKTGPYFWILMEYVNGQTLRDVLQSGPVEPRDALAIVMQMCTALEYAHNKGVVHRDIKPENVLITQDGSAKIADFGLAKVVARGRQDYSLTGSYQAMGTPHYMAPEQFERPKDVDHRADIYSLGVVLYEVLTGELPVGRFSMPSQRARVDARLDQIVTKALQKDPQRRYQTASDVGTAVRDVATPRPRTSAAAIRRTARNRSSTVSLAITIVGLLLFAILFARFGGMEVLGWGTANAAANDFKAGASLLQRDPSSLAGIALLERSREQDENYVGLASHLLPAMERGARKLLRDNDIAGAVSMAKRRHDYYPSPQTESFYRELERSAQEKMNAAIRIISPEQEEVLDSRRVELVGRVSPEASGAQLTASGIPIQIAPDGSFTHAYDLPGDGRHFVELTLSYGDALSTSLLREFIVDMEVPELLVEYPTPGQVVPLVFEVKGTVHDTSAVTVHIDDKKAILSNEGPWSIPVTLEEGLATIAVAATDQRGLVRKIEIEVVVDGMPPEIEHIGSADVIAGRGDHGYSRFRISDAHGVASAEWDGKEIFPGPDGVVGVKAELPPEKASPRPYTIKAKDRAGNWAERTVSALRDETNPNIQYEEQEPALSGRTYELAVKCHDDTECTLSLEDGTTFSSDNGNFTVPIEVPAELPAQYRHDIRFRVVDLAGNAQEGLKTFVVHPLCESCSGNGQCTKCHGEGRRPRDCKNKGCSLGVLEVPCEACHGFGTSACIECSGTGKGERDTCWRCTKGRIGCVDCSETGKTLGPCLNAACKDGIITQFPDTGKVCRVCKGTDIAPRKCKACNGEKSLPCNENGCERGIVTNSCVYCKKGRTLLPCDTCNGKKRVPKTCPECSAGTLLVNCISCRDGQCKPCSGNGYLPNTL